MKTIVVVGGSGGLGSALVTALLDRHYQVVVVGRNPAADSRVAAFHAVDTAHADWPVVYRVIRQTIGPIDAVVFVSGTSAYGRTAMVPQESARQMMELNFWSCTSAAQAAAEHWSAGRQPGKFLAILSIVARHGVPFEAHYAASKAATARFLECLDLEYGGAGIQLFSAYPGMLKTPFRNQAQWHGLTPGRGEGGTEPAITAEALIALLEGRRQARVIGWRERIIALADRIWPGLYDRVVLRARVRKQLGNHGQLKAGALPEGKTQTQNSGGSTYSL
jgi:short-subunit dehydrogenase